MKQQFSSDMSETSIQLRLKVVIDRVFAAITLLLCSPLMLAIALAIKLDDGDLLLFRQDRIGRGERKFRVFKFRTMTVNADDLLDARGHVGSQNRVTRVGKFLRRSSLDELPQLVNVLRGEMSLVGPRPVLPQHVLRYSPEQRRRFAVKPGITGLAQVSGRNTLKWSRRLALDVEYVDRYSLWLDAVILLRTVKVVLLREGMVMDRNPEQVDDLPLVYVPPVDRPQETIT